MPYLSSALANSALLSLVLAASTLSACAGQSDRRGPPPERAGADRQGSEGQTERTPRAPVEISGTFVRPVGLLFSGMDQNSDASISKTELSAGIDREWASFGRNPSGAAFGDWSRKMLGSIDSMPSFFSFDSDFNGVVTESEFKKTLRGEFDRLDKDDDGIVTRTEMVLTVNAARGRSRGEGQNEDRGQGGKGGQRGGGRR